MHHNHDPRKKVSPLLLYTSADLLACLFDRKAHSGTSRCGQASWSQSQKYRMLNEKYTGERDAGRHKTHSSSNKPMKTKKTQHTIETYIHTEKTTSSSRPAGSRGWMCQCGTSRDGRTDCLVWSKPRVGVPVCPYIGMGSEVFSQNTDWWIRVETGVSHKY